MNPIDDVPFKSNYISIKLYIVFFRNEYAKLIIYFTNNHSIYYFYLQNKDKSKETENKNTVYVLTRIMHTFAIFKLLYYEITIKYPCSYFVH
ncbi:hypothetical protein SDC9_118623 [bioreactor metagenome]|uniref:Uncharacterized protein n=1 Tax=bioreactor metagenome TaxID=1076179 RepID=A0A645C285_9ZZZZ